MNNLTPAEFYRNQAAFISENSQLRPLMAFRVDLDLTTARDDGNPFVLNNPFDAFYVEEATDNASNVKIAMSSGESYATRNYLTLRKNDSAKLSNPIRSAYITWDAQPGKTITIMFFTNVQFTPGSLRQVLSGGVTITTGSGMTPDAKVTVLTTATQLFAASTARTKVTIQNIGGSPIYVSGTNAVTLDTGANPGILLNPTDTYEWINSGDCYAIADGASSIVSLNTES